MIYFYLTQAIKHLLNNLYEKVFGNIKVFRIKKTIRSNNIIERGVYMNSKRLSLFVIMITVICVCIILYNSGERAIVYNKNNEVKTKGVTDENNKKNNDEGSNSLGKSSKDNIENKNISNPSSKGEADRTSSENQRNNENVENSSTDESVNEIDSQYSLNKKEIEVFKVSKGEIKDMLSLSDMLKIESIGGKLSGTDFTRIKQYLQKGDDESVIKALKLLKERLSDKDYEKFKVVAGKFINLEVIGDKWVDTFD